MKTDENAKENCEKAQHNVPCNSIIIVTSLLSKFCMFKFYFLGLLNIFKIGKNEFCFILNIFLK